MVEDRANHDREVWLDSVAYVQGSCKHCAHCIKELWFCEILQCYTEPNGPNYACGQFKEE